MSKTTRDNDPMKRVIRCKYCGKPEYYGDFRWLSGKMLCRNCYRADYEEKNHQPYIWDDLDGERPSEDEVCEPLPIGVYSVTDVP